MSERSPERSTQQERARQLSRLFPQGVPPLWCPPVTHYNDQGGLDRRRMAAHFEFMAPWIQAFLVPGSTGDGWELSAAEARQVVQAALEEARRLQVQVLIGALNPDAAAARRTILETLAWLKQLTGQDTTEAALEESRVCGFAVCPPRGEQVSQSEMQAALSSILELRVPVALYQLPQVTQNEMSPALVAHLARHFANFIVFKDTSGADRVASSGEDFGGVRLVRGAEGDYARWLAGGGGPYHGFLLSSANCLGRQLQEVIQQLEAGQVQAAQVLSQRVSKVVQAVFALVKQVPDGNPFANANKAMDQFMAFGPRAAEVPTPRLHTGRRLPTEIVRATGTILAKEGLLPAQGYLE